MSRYDELDRRTLRSLPYKDENRPVYAYREVSTLLDSWSFGKYQIILLILCSAGYFAVCADLLLIVYIQPSLKTSFGISNMQFAFLSFASCMSGNLGSVVFGYCADRFGRRTPFILSASIAALFGMSSILAYSYWLLLTLRTIVGLGLGGLGTIDFLVFNEMCPKNVRGKATLVITVFGALGVLLMAGLNLIDWDKFLVGSEPWQVLIFLGSLPMLVVCIARAIIVDESPKYLVSRGNYWDAVNVLRKIASWNGERFEPEADTPTLNRLQSEQYHAPGIAMLQTTEGTDFCRPLKSFWAVIKYDPRLAICLFGAWLFQGLANWGLTLFLPQYLTTKGAISAKWTIFLMVACEVPGIFLAFCLVDIRAIGRLNLMRALFAFAAASSFAAAFISQKVAIVVLCCAIYFFMIPNWGVLFTYSSEIYPTQIRSTANGLFQLHAFIGGLFSPFLSSTLIDEFSTTSTVDYYMLAWASCLALGFVSACLLKKETANITI